MVNDAGARHMTKPAQDIGFITRIHEGKKQWLGLLQVIEGKMHWEDAPRDTAMFSKSIFDELVKTNPGINYRPCARLIMKRNYCWASREDMLATVQELV
jgi:hypothetical protein